MLARSSEPRVTTTKELVVVRCVHIKSGFDEGYGRNSLRMTCNESSGAVISIQSGDFIEQSPADKRRHTVRICVFRRDDILASLVVHSHESEYADTHGVPAFI